MQPETWKKLEAIFFTALDLSPDARGPYLDRACAGDPSFRAEIEAVLAGHAAEEAGGNGRHALEPGVPLTAPGSLVGTRIGPYRLEALVDRGGMGEVYRAQRVDEQFHQEVAVKLIRPSSAADELARRFHLEREVLARLQHPNIAALLDGGVTDDGRPYLVMQYVDGVSITAYADEHRLPVRERLALVRTVCDAVQYAHGNLIVHRDLKPTNILVTRSGQVRLLDFGIAKLLDPDLLGVAAPATEDLFLLTPEHAAPEQILGTQITTSTDVYALGVLLYQLLIGVRPFHATSRPELRRAVCERQPTAPSGALRSGVTGAGVAERPDPVAIAALRATRPDALARQLRGDLDQVVLKALRKEPERRYASAGQLGEDLARLLAGRPVIAQPDTFGYRARTFVRRNRGSVAVASAFGALLVASSVATAWQARLAARERDVARQEAAKADQVRTFLLDLFEAATPVTNRRDTIPVREFLDSGRVRAQALAGQPEVQAQMLGVLAGAYFRLGRSDLGVVLESQALAIRRGLFGSAHLETATSLYDLGVMLQEQEQFERALAAYREALQTYRALYGAMHPAALKAAYRTALMLHQTHAYAEADSVLGEWEAGFRRIPLTDDPDLAWLLGQMGMVLQVKGRLVDAEAHVRRALAMKRRLYGDRDFRLGDDLTTLSGILIAARRPAEAEEVARQAVTLHRGLFSEGHNGLARSVDALGEALLEQGRYAEAEPVLREALALYRALHREENTIVGRGYMMLAQLYHRWRRYGDAEPYYRRAIEVYERRFGTDYVVTIEHREMLADLLRDGGDFPAAERILLDAHRTLTTQRGADDRYTDRARRRLLKLYEAWGKPDRMAAYLPDSG